MFFLKSNILSNIRVYENIIKHLSPPISSTSNSSSFLLSDKILGSIHHKCPLGVVVYEFYPNRLYARHTIYLLAKSSNRLLRKYL